MTNKKLLAGILGILLVFNFVLVGCDDGSSPKDALPRDALDGTTWGSLATGTISNISTTITENLKFTSPDYEWILTYDPPPPEEMSIMYPTLVQGTYTVYGNTVILKLPPEVPVAQFVGTFSANQLTLEGSVYTRK
jgi:hypothetical protein